MGKNEIPLIEAKKTPRKEVILDPKGFFIIEVHPDSIMVEFYENVKRDDRIISGKLRKVFTGSHADALSDTIAHHIKDLRPDHYLYLGRELLKAELALQNNQSYTQGGC